MTKTGRNEAKSYFDVLERKNFTAKISSTMLQNPSKRTGQQIK
jgi:hypothetical protein